MKNKTSLTDFHLWKQYLKHQKSDNPDFTQDLWDVVKTTSGYDTRNRNALPLSFEDMQSAQAIGSAESRLPYSVRTLEWLNENGRCMDNIWPGNSTIRQAGRGAFASRQIPKGGLVAPGPLLHIANRTTLNLYAVGDDGVRDTTKLMGSFTLGMLGKVPVVYFVDQMDNICHWC